MKKTNKILQQIRDNFQGKEGFLPSYRQIIMIMLPQISPQAQEKWPLDFADCGYQTVYKKIERSILYRMPQDYDLEGIQLQTEVYNQQERYFLDQSYYLDDGQIIIHLNNLYRMQGHAKSNFATTVTKKLQDFIDAQDLKREDRKSYPSHVLLEATSNNDQSGIASSGGYIWANQGFDFSSAEECQKVREHFQSFLRRQGINFEDKDLSYLKKPVHFAAFDSGNLVKDKFGRLTRIGKAFLLIHEEWQGKLESFNTKREEKRFAKIYNQNPGRRSYAKAFKALSSGYKAMVNKYKVRTQQKQNRIQKMAAFALGKFRHLVDKFLQTL